MVYSDTSGVLYFKKNINVGNYKFNILYILNGLSTMTNYNLLIIPNIDYGLTMFTLLYTQQYFSSMPYFDQSGGNFYYSDISGYLVTRNIITYDISNGYFYFSSNPDVGIYNLQITYIVKNISNYQNIIFYR